VYEVGNDSDICANVFGEDGQVLKNFSARVIKDSNHEFGVVDLEPYMVKDLC
jgi:hypothetical protein